MPRFPQASIHLHCPADASPPSQVRGVGFIALTPRHLSDMNSQYPHCALFGCLASTFLDQGSWRSGVCLAAGWLELSGPHKPGLRWQGTHARYVPAARQLPQGSSCLLSGLCGHHPEVHVYCTAVSGKLSAPSRHRHPHTSSSRPLTHPLPPT